MQIYEKKLFRPVLTEKKYYWHCFQANAICILPPFRHATPLPSRWRVSDTLFRACSQPLTLRSVVV